MFCVGEFRPDQCSFVMLLSDHR